MINSISSQSLAAALSSLRVSGTDASFAECQQQQEASSSFVSSSHSTRLSAKIEKALKHEAVCDHDADLPLSSKLLKLSEIPFVGREREMEDLHGALDKLLLDKSKNHQAPKVISISGAPGSGKSTLAQQLRTRVTEAGGYYLHGKFDLQGQAEAYGGLAMAMEDFAAQILERDWDMAIRRRLKEFLQGNETVLLDAFPGLDRILTADDSSSAGKVQDESGHSQEQPARQQRRRLGGSKSQDNKNNKAKEEESQAQQRSKRRVFFFQQFFHAVLSLKGYQDEDVHHDTATLKQQDQQQQPPILMVVDDVHVADESSLDLLSSLVRDPDLPTFVLVTTRRPIPPADQDQNVFLKQLDKWRSERVTIQEYTLENLCISSIETMVAASLDQDNSDNDDDDDIDDYELQQELAAQNATDLAQIIHQKTQGNPFFALECLKALVDQHVLIFSYATMTWRFEKDNVHSFLATIAATTTAADNNNPVVDLLIGNVKRLPSNQQVILLISSCLGGTFKAPMIRRVVQSLHHQKQQQQQQHNNNNGSRLSQMVDATVPVLETLETFVRVGYLERSGKSSFYFVHDLIRQAAKEFVSTQEMEWMRLQVGESLLRTMKRSTSSSSESSATATTTSKKFKNKQSNNKESNLFLGVDLCNSAMHLYYNTPGDDDQQQQQADKTGRLDLMDLALYNCCAGEKAMRESAFLQAVRYMKTGITALQQYQQYHHHNTINTTGKEEHDKQELLVSLLAGAAEASYCSGNYEDMNTYAEQLLQRKDDDCPEDIRLRMLHFKVQSSQAQEFAHEALDIGYAAMELLGMATFPRYPKPHHVLIELLKTKKALRNHTQETLQQLPIVTDKRRIAAMEFLNAMKGPAAVSNQDFLIVIFLKSIRWSVKYGLGKHSPGGFAVYGTIIHAMFGEANAGIMYGDVALALAARMGVQETTAETSCFTYGFLRHWTTDMAACYAPLVYAQKLAVECGDIETVTYCIFFGTVILWCTSMVTLPVLGNNLQRKCAMCRDFKHWAMLDIMTNLATHLRRLCHRDERSFSWLDGPEQQATEKAPDTTTTSAAKPKAANSKDPSIELFYDCMALQTHLLLDERAEALECAGRTYAMGTELCVGQGYVPLTQFYRALVYLDPCQKRVSWKHFWEANRALKLLRKWAKTGSGSSVHMVGIVEAEFSRIKRNNGKARDLYTAAIRAAEESGHTHDAGLGHERAAIFYQKNLHDTKRASYHIDQAIRCFHDWGATAVVDRLKRSYGDLISSAETVTSCASVQFFLDKLVVDSY